MLKQKRQELDDVKQEKQELKAENDDLYSKSKLAKMESSCSRRGSMAKRSWRIPKIRKRNYDPPNHWLIINRNRNFPI